MNFSIIIPTYNRAQMLARIIRNIAKLDYQNGNFEVIIVDNGSIDDTFEVILGLVKQNSHLSLSYIFESRQGPSFARDTGITKARYSKIIFLDDDTVIPKTLLTDYHHAYKHYPQCAIIGGRLIAKHPSNNNFLRL